MQKSVFISELQANFKDQLLTDEVSLGIYATDASLYQIFPKAILTPTNEKEILQAMEIANRHKISVISRGGGTGLAGQTIGDGLILDLSKNYNQILEFNQEERWIRVQPGIVRDVLNDFLKPHGLHFSPDPATSSRAAIGGMIANNSSGTKSIVFGKTIDHVLETRVALADGSILDLSHKTKAEVDQISSSDNREGSIYRTLTEIMDNHSDEIKSRFPKVMRRVGGYNLDEFINRDEWNLSKLITGSEGTLATILEAKLHLDPLPKEKSICLVHFKTLSETIRSVQHIVNYNPSAVEILDEKVIQLSRNNLTTQKSCHVIHGNPEAVLIVEHYGNSIPEIEERQATMISYLEDHGFGYAYPIYHEGPEYQDVWSIRKKGLGLLLGMKTKKKPLAFIEDASIPLDVLPNYIEEVQALCARLDTSAAMYAHASVGVIHVRPILDLREAADIARFKEISEETFKLVKKYGGSWSGEHGDGLVRSFYNEAFFGKPIYQAFKRIKRVFDPENIMNPGKIVDAPPIDTSLRYGASYKDNPLETIYQYRNDGSFQAAVHMCSGVGECRKVNKGTMCPSYMATRDEEHSTRGRANALRLAMSGQFNNLDITSSRVIDTLDLCLSCKACKSECPSNVDMAKLKSEVLQMKYAEQGTTLREGFIRDSTNFARLFSGASAPLINSIQRSKLFRWVLEQLASIESDRILPEYSRQTFITWYKNRTVVPEVSKATQIVLFADTYLNYHEPQIGKSALALLEGLGYHVEVAQVGCCQRPRISNGFLKKAKQEGLEVAKKLKKFIDQGKIVVVCEPGCASALTDDLADLIENTDIAQSLKTGVKPLDLFLYEEKDRIPLKLIQSDYQKLLIHGHCHEKSLFEPLALKKVLEGAGLEAELIDSGCCGMAGSFGYEKEHYALSKKIANQRLLPALQSVNEESGIIANGFSCRHQINHFSQKKARHWVEYLHIGE